MYSHLPSSFSEKNEHSPSSWLWFGDGGDPDDLWIGYCSFCNVLFHPLFLLEFLFPCPVVELLIELTCTIHRVPSIQTHTVLSSACMVLFSSPDVLPFMAERQQNSIGGEKGDGKVMSQKVQQERDCGHKVQKSKATTSTTISSQPPQSITAIQHPPYNPKMEIVRRRVQGPPNRTVS
ncbi:hypothetical protein Fcan01_21187 [Folsomia candida]|uniref:Uncharacterized protein n=1 Tax=Folsomia candida TaxID=158441 RepID=A0A226DEF6_FOLCA|nr:hypothetical protein Fcan01_21187 [Folsomia candida]